MTRGSLIQIGPIEGDAGGILNRLLKIAGIAASLATGTAGFTQAIAGYPEAKRSFPVLRRDIVDTFDRAFDAIKGKGFTFTSARVTPYDLAELEADTDDKPRLLEKRKKPGHGGPKGSR